MRIWFALTLISLPAAWPGTSSATESDDAGSDHWSLQPVQRPTPPALDQAQHPTNAIDSFVFAKLAKANLSPSHLAKRQVLIRRLYLVMLGMHPTPKEVAAFENDPSPDAWERLVDRVLEDPRLGERWAQHWLDAASGQEREGSASVRAATTSDWNRRRRSQ